MADVRGKSSTEIIEQTAEQLKATSPDVVFLRGVSGWKMCSQLAAALKPVEYRVLVCSAFHDPAGGGPAAGQVAILARNSAYFSWSEAWSFEGSEAERAEGGRSSAAGRAPGTARPTVAGGFCFAAVQVADHRFGFSCVDLPAMQKGFESQAVKQWLETLNGYRGWANNRLEGFVSATFGLSGGNADTARMLSDAAFADPLKGNAGIQAPQVLKTHLFPSTAEPVGLLLSAWPATCDFDFKPVPVVVVAANPPTVTPPLPAPAAPAATLPVSREPTALWWIGGSAAFLVLMTIVVMQIAIRRRLVRLQSQGALVPLGPGSYSLMVPGPVATSQTPPLANPTRDTMLRQSLLAHMAEWLKHAFVQRLVRDRQNLIEAQHIAAQKVSSMDERLARVEAKIQKETAAYEKQIEQLGRELSSAREENRELIRTQIRLLKSEMETTRARVLESESAGG
jgi:hypothetical protein